MRQDGENSSFAKLVRSCFILMVSARWSKVLCPLFHIFNVKLKYLLSNQVLLRYGYELTGWSSANIYISTLGLKTLKNRICITGKYFSEALILASTNPQYDNRLFMELP